MYIGLHVKYPLLLSDFNWTWISLDTFSITEFHENPSSGSPVVPLGRTDMTSYQPLFAVFRTVWISPSRQTEASARHACSVCEESCVHISVQMTSIPRLAFSVIFITSLSVVNILKPPGHVMLQQFNIQQLYVLPALYLCVLYLSENKQRLVPLTA